MLLVSLSTNSLITQICAAFKVNELIYFLKCLYKINSLPSMSVSFYLLLFLHFCFLLPPLLLFFSVPLTPSFSPFFSLTPLSFSQCTSSSHFSFYHFSPHWLPSLFPFVHFFATVSCKEQVTNKTDSLAPPAICRPQYKAGIKILAVSWSLVPPKKQG